jgi:hypothetical protein
LRRHETNITYRNDIIDYRQRSFVKLTYDDSNHFWTLTLPPHTPSENCLLMEKKLNLINHIPNLIKYHNLSGFANVIVLNFGNLIVNYEHDYFLQYRELTVTFGVFKLLGKWILYVKPIIQYSVRRNRNRPQILD